MPVNPVSLALIAAAVVALIVVRIVNKKKTNKAEKPEQAVVAEDPAPAPAPVRNEIGAGAIQLHNVPEEVAAVLMAIVADKMETPLDQLRFISVREVA